MDVFLVILPEELLRCQCHSVTRTDTTVTMSVCACVCSIPILGPFLFVIVESESYGPADPSFQSLVCHRSQDGADLPICPATAGEFLNALPRRSLRSLECVEYYVGSSCGRFGRFPTFVPRRPCSQMAPY